VRDAEAGRARRRASCPCALDALHRHGCAGTEEHGRGPWRAVGHLRCRP
jgi:hypothetical protein